MMMCKESSDAHLFSQNIIDFDGPRHAWWTSAGMAGQCKWNEPKGVFSQSLKIMRLQFICLFACFVGIHKLKDMNSLWGNICFGRYKQI